MAKHVIKYLLDGDGKVPAFVESGGMFILNDEMVGLSVDEAKRYLPSTIDKMTKAEFITRAQAVPTMKIDGTLNSAAEMEAIVDVLLSDWGIPDYV
jgi:hypothetical protein